jgi:hypothetical protein
MSFVCFVPFVVKSLVVNCLWLRLCRAGIFLVNSDFLIERENLGLWQLPFTH